jgi:radical SAM protein with 4Fe4S-binding SPASM domain
MSRYEFGNIFTDASGYTKDRKYENFDRINDCIEEKCAYLPICGGGCTYHAAIENGGTIEGFSKRHCKKVLLHDLNDGLLRLSYGS